MAVVNLSHPRENTGIYPDVGFFSELLKKVLCFLASVKKTSWDIWFLRFIFYYYFYMLYGHKPGPSSNKGDLDYHILI